jgi:preprotein translocase subunit YajC
LIFYFLVFRPQNKKQKDLEQTIQAAEKGDEVVTTGGLHGKVHVASENALTIEIANVKGAPVRVDIERSRVERVVKAETLREEAREKAKSAKKGGKEKGGDES